jgi:hypothetical protein
MVEKHSLNGSLEVSSPYFSDYRSFSFRDQKWTSAIKQLIYHSGKNVAYLQLLVLRRFEWVNCYPENVPTHGFIT